ncbi:MAG: hypothetical protein OEV30_08860 [Ignavibacteria bacterium]|nr:hypothetical protein [Ignavibacteria bacterium]
MMYVAKGLEALGIASVLIGLVQGIQTDDMWIELYLGLIGIALFTVGWLIEKFNSRKSRQEPV